MNMHACDLEAIALSHGERNGRLWLGCPAYQDQKTGYLTLLSQVTGMIVHSSAAHSGSGSRPVFTHRGYALHSECICMHHHVRDVLTVVGSASWFSSYQRTAAARACVVLC